MFVDISWKHVTSELMLMTFTIARYSYMSIYVKCLQANPVLCLLSCNAHVRINADFWFEHCTIFIYYFKRVIDKAKQTDYKLNEFCTYRVCFNIFLPSAILINLRQLRKL